MRERAENPLLPALHHARAESAQPHPREPLHVEELVELTRHHREHGEPTLACPWRVAREAAARADVVVGDYNHLFNEGVRDSTLAALGLTLEQLIIVVDEAHNLPERIRSGLERRLTPLLVRNAKPDLEEHLGTVSERSDADRTRT